MLLVIVLGVVVVAGAFVCGIRLWARRCGILCFRTMNGRAWVIPSYDDGGSPVRVLRVGGGNQSATYVDEALWTVPPGAYIERFDLVFDAAIPVHDVLMLGGGGYSYPKHLISTRPDARIDVVEIDPQVTSIARRWFFLDRLIEEYATDETGRLGIFTQDARAFLEQEGDLYDAIVNDTFAGKRPLRALMSAEGLQLVKGRLRRGGVYVTNVVATLEGRRSRVLHETVAACRGVFEFVRVVSCTTDDPGALDNRLVVAGDVPCRCLAEENPST